MVGAINAPTSGNTLDAFILLASNATLSTAPEGGATGGTLSNGGGNGNLSSSISSYTTAVSTSAVLTTYTSESTTATATLSSSTIFSTGSSAVPAPTTSLVPVSGASSMSANVFGVGAILFGAMAMM
jgi:hypothetical protein